MDAKRNWHDEPPTIAELREHHARMQRNPKVIERLKRAIANTDGDTEI